MKITRLRTQIVHLPIEPPIQTAITPRTKLRRPNRAISRPVQGATTVPPR